MFILNQLSDLYGQPTPAILKMNDTVFQSPYSAANAPEVLFRRIKERAETALLGRNPYTDRQLITNAIHLLLTTGLYTRPFKEWDCITLPAQMWIALRTLIQEAFRWRLNATAPTAGAHGYVLAQLFGQNAFGALATTDNSDTESVDGSVATQMAALTYQSHLTANTAANTSVRQEQQLAHLAAQQEMMHQNMDQLIAGMNVVIFNQSNEGRGVGHFPPRGYGSGSSGRFCTRRGRYQRGHGRGSSVFGFHPTGGFHPSIGRLPGFPHGNPHPAGIPAYCPTQGGPQPYHPPVQTGLVFGTTTPCSGAGASLFEHCQTLH